MRTIPWDDLTHPLPADAPRHTPAEVANYLREHADALESGTAGAPAPCARWLRILAQHLDGKAVLEPAER